MYRWALAGGLALWLFGAASAGGGDAASGGPARASAGQPIMVGRLWPRTGPVENIGIRVCLGVGEYIELVNGQGDLEGRPLVGPAVRLAAEEDAQKFYLGVAMAGRRSFREAKQYEREKRWLR